MDDDAVNHRSKRARDQHPLVINEDDLEIDQNNEDGPPPAKKTNSEIQMIGNSASCSSVGSEKESKDKNGKRKCSQNGNKSVALDEESDEIPEIPHSKVITSTPNNENIDYFEQAQSLGNFSMSDSTLASGVSDEEMANVNDYVQDVLVYDSINDNKLPVKDVTRELSSHDFYKNTTFYEIQSGEWTAPSDNSFASSSSIISDSSLYSNQICNYKVLKSISTGIDLITHNNRGKTIKIYDVGNRTNMIKVPFEDSIIIQKNVLADPKHGKMCKIGDRGQVFVIEKPHGSDSFLLSVVSPNALVKKHNENNQRFKSAPMSEKQTVKVLACEFEPFTKGFKNCIDFVGIKHIHRRLRHATYANIYKKFGNDNPRVSAKSYANILKGIYFNTALSDHKQKYPFRVVFADIYHQLMQEDWSFI